MKKQIYTSKTLWGFGLLGVTLIAQMFGAFDESIVAEVLKVVFGLLGIYGIRDAIK